jgi:hypothetical protein
MIWIYLDRVCHKLDDWRNLDERPDGGENDYFRWRVGWPICQKAMLWADKNDKWELFD